jgi:hypothetical protein
LACIQTTNRFGLSDCVNLDFMLEIFYGPFFIRQRNNKNVVIGIKNEPKSFVVHVPMMMTNFNRNFNGKKRELERESKLFFYFQKCSGKIVFCSKPLLHLYGVTSTCVPTSLKFYFG